VAELGAVRDQQAGQVAALAAEVSRLRTQLADQDIELRQLRGQQRQLEQEVEGLTTKLLRARAEADRMEARIAELEVAAREVRQPVEADSARLVDSDAGRVFYHAFPARRDRLVGTVFLLVAAGAGFPAVLAVVNLVKNFSTDSPWPLVLFVTSVITITFGAGGFEMFGSTWDRGQVQVTGHDLNLPGQGSFQWDQVGKITRTAGYVIYGEPCKKCGGHCFRTFSRYVRPILAVYSRDGARLGGGGETIASTVEDDWARFSDAIRFAAPHVVIEELAHPEAPVGSSVL
jgi:hypothetical protein